MMVTTNRLCVAKAIMALPDALSLVTASFLTQWRRSLRVRIKNRNSAAYAASYKRSTEALYIAGSNRLRLLCSRNRCFLVVRKATLTNLAPAAAPLKLGKSRARLFSSTHRLCLSHSTEPQPHQPPVSPPLRLLLPCRCFCAPRLIFNPSDN